MKRTALFGVIITIVCSTVFSLTPEAEKVLLDTFKLFAYDTAHPDSGAVTLTVKNPAEMAKMGPADCTMTLKWKNMPFKQQKDFIYFPGKSSDAYPSFHTGSNNNDNDVFRRITFGNKYGVTQYRVRDVIDVSEVQLGSYATQTTTTFKYKNAYSLDIDPKVNPYLHSFVNEWHEIASNVRKEDALMGTNTGKNIVNWTIAISGALLIGFGTTGLITDTEWENPGATAAAMIGGGTVLASIPFFANAKIKKEAIERFQKLVDEFQNTYTGVFELQ